MTPTVAAEIPSVLAAGTDGKVESALAALARAQHSIIPTVPETLADTGLPATFYEQHILKILYFRGEMFGRELARAVGLKFSLIEPVVEAFKQNKAIEMKRSAGLGNFSGCFALTESGRRMAREYLELDLYTGPAPVPLAQYTAFVRRQRQPDGWLTPDMLARAYGKMVLGPDILAQIGPAVSSGNSFLIYGQPGNGKTFLAEALGNLDKSPIYMPYAIEYQGSIIQIFDPIFHQQIQDEQSIAAVALDPAHDARWFRCRRPFIVSGGELALPMLDLSYNSASKVYDAPLQLKANNGIYLIDDFGRQLATPAEILNRWIIPMERRIDYLTLQTGGKVTVPFETFLVFSTNLRPDNLGDEAFLRRIQYKMHLRNPTPDEFIEIFRRVCDSRGLECADELPQRFVSKFYTETGKRMRRCHPRDVISHAVDLIHFESREMVLTEELLDHAFHSCFVQVGDMEA